MRPLTDHDGIRDAAWELRAMGQLGDAWAGCFKLPSVDDGATLRVMASRQVFGWDHVSVSRKDRTPSWAELEQVKRRFFLDDETAMQLHVPPAEHVNNHETCLHLWRPCTTVIPRPPAMMVGVPGATPTDVEAVVRERRSRAA